MKITVDHELFDLLNDDGDMNWLIFEGNPFDASDVEITHFGPFGNKKDSTNNDERSKAYEGLQNALGQHGLTEAEHSRLREEDPAEIHRRGKKFWKNYVVEKMAFDILTPDDGNASENIPGAVVAKRWSWLAVILAIVAAMTYKFVFSEGA